MREVQHCPLYEVGHGHQPVLRVEEAAAACAAYHAWLARQHVALSRPHAGTSQTQLVEVAAAEEEEEVAAHVECEVGEGLANFEVGCGFGHVVRLVETGCALVVVGFVGQEEHRGMVLGQEVVAWVVTCQHDVA